MRRPSRSMCRPITPLVGACRSCIADSPWCAPARRGAGQPAGLPFHHRFSNLGNGTRYGKIVELEGDRLASIDGRLDPMPIDDALLRRATAARDHAEELQREAA